MNHKIITGIRFLTFSLKPFKNFLNLKIIPVMQFIECKYHQLRDDITLYKYHPITNIIAMVFFSLCLRTPNAFCFDGDYDGYVPQWLSKVASKLTLEPEPNTATSSDSGYEDDIERALIALENETTHSDDYESDSPAYFRYQNESDDSESDREAASPSAPASPTSFLDEASHAIPDSPIPAITTKVSNEKNSPETLPVYQEAMRAVADYSVNPMVPQESARSNSPMEGPLLQEALSSFPDAPMIGFNIAETTPLNLPTALHSLFTDPVDLMTPAILNVPNTPEISKVNPTVVPSGLKDTNVLLHENSPVAQASYVNVTLPLYTNIILELNYIENDTEEFKSIIIDNIKNFLEKHPWDIMPKTQESFDDDNSYFNQLLKEIRRQNLDINLSSDNKPDFEFYEAAVFNAIGLTLIAEAHCQLTHQDVLEFMNQESNVTWCLQQYTSKTQYPFSDAASNARTLHAAEFTDDYQHHDHN